MIGAKGWCPACRTRRTIVDEHDESTYEGSREMGYQVTDFDCGHDSQSTPRVIGASPGGESLVEALDQSLLRARQARQSEWEEEYR